MNRSSSSAPTLADGAAAGVPLSILVAGMHRSGTSAVGGVLNILGAAVPGVQMAPQSDNPKGFFESVTVARFHERLMARFDSRWDDVLPVSPDWNMSSVGRAFADELFLLAGQELSSDPVVLIKDPRICQFIPMWVDALTRLNRRVVCVLPVRHPLEVADSLRRRNGLSRAHALMLWLQHVVAAERATRDLPRTIVLYADLMRDWRGAVRKIASDLNLVWPRDPMQAQVEIDAFLEPEMRNHRNDGAPFEAYDTLHGLCAQAWAAFQSLARDAADENAMANLDRVADSLKQAVGVFRPLLLTARSDDLDARLVERDQKLSELQSANEALKEAAEDHARLLSAARLDSENAEQEIERERSATAVTTLAANQKIDQLLSEAESNRRRLRVQVSQLDALQREVQARDARIRALQTSPSRMLFRPFRAVIRVVRGELTLNQALRRTARILRGAPAPAARHAVAQAKSRAGRTGLIDAPDRRLTRGRETWPPIPLNDYWLPERLRNHIINHFGESLIDTYSYLFSVIAFHADAPWTFDGSAAQGTLVERARTLASRRPIGEPEVTVVIPAYNNLVYTLTAIVSLLELNENARYEILVGDDGSTDATPAVIGAIGGPVRHVPHAVNRGFLDNCNLTAEQARGAHIVFLNNDVIVMPGWLDSLQQTFTANPKVGLVGSKLLNGDGTLQEAGGILWRDGTGWNFGLGQDATRPEYNYLKPVDYCSGASIALPADLWRELGGFDPLFAPAYCEDSDLCMRVRAAGREVVFQPFSQLVHHEGRSHGRDLTQGIKAYQQINQRKLADRWSEVWSVENFEPGQSAFLARDRSRGRPHIVIVDHYVPQWDRDAGSRTIYHYIRTFVDCGFQVTFWPDNLYRDPVYTPNLQNMGVEVIYSTDYFRKFPAWMKENGSYIDYILLSRPYIAINYIDTIRKNSNAKVLYYGHDLHFKRMQTEFDILGTEGLPHEIKKMKKMEMNMCRKADVYLFPSFEEIQLVKSEIDGVGTGMNVPMNIFEPGEIATEYAPAGRDEFSLLFVGGFGHGPNADAVNWFLAEIMPRLIAEDARYTLMIAGSSPPQEITELVGAGVQVLGPVTDGELDELYARAGVAIAPLRFGAGVKGKVIEALAKGVPVVTTSVGVQGIPGAERFVLVGADPDAFAQAVLDVAARPAETADRVGRGLDFIRRNYSRDGLRRQLAALIPELNGQ